MNAPTADVDFDRLIRLYQTSGQSAYPGEAVSQLEHGVQAAWLAELARADSPLITAALLHDVGHLLEGGGESEHAHEEIGARWLEAYFGPEVTRPVLLHVAAKRYLCATDTGYLNRLSPASLASLRVQGGPMTPAEVATFEADPFHKEAVRLRRWDEEAKVAGLMTPPLERFRRHLEEARALRDAGRAGGLGRR